MSPAAASGRTLVVEADGGSRGNPGPAGYGAVVKDGGPKGVVLAEVAEGIGRATNNVAEYGGLLAGLKAARDIDPGASVLVRMDSKLVVEQMSGRWKVKHADMQRLWQEAREVWPRDQVRFEWIPRAQNGHADRLANEAMDAAAQGRTWAPRGVADGVRSGSRTGAPADATPLSTAGTAADLFSLDDDDAVPPVVGAGRTRRSTQEDAVSTPSTAGEGEAPVRRKSYKLLTGPDTPDFCQKVSDHLDQGYLLHGSPALVFDGTEVRCAQAVVLPEDQR